MTSKSSIERRFRIVGRDEGPEATDAPPRRPPPTLRELKRMSAAELTRLYRATASPSSVSELDGELRGTLLTLAGPLSQGIARRITNRIAGSKRFPWAGKTFQSWADERGSGINRVRVLGERLWFHFESRVETSRIDGAPCVVLDYGGADNSWPIRQVRDELRQVGPGLWMGPATVRGHVALFFAVHAP